jgi:hypothetical protein
MVTFSALITSYLAHIEKEQRTVDKAKRVLAQVLAVIGNRSVSDISPFQIEKWRLARVQDVDQSTVNRELNIIRGMFRRGIEWKVLLNSPVDDVKKVPYRSDSGSPLERTRDRSRRSSQRPLQISLCCVGPHWNASPASASYSRCVESISGQVGLRFVGKAAGWSGSMSRRNSEVRS